MTKLFFSKIDDTSINKEILKNYFSEEVLERIEKSESDFYKKRRYTSKYMLIKIFELLQFDLEELRTIYYAPNGKMICPNKKYTISISYSDALVACLISGSNKSLDIEKTTKTTKKNHINILNKLSNSCIKSNAAFFKKWTELEAITKIYDTKSLSEILFNYTNLKQGIHVKHIRYQKDYLIALASRQPIKKINIITI